MSSKVTSQAKPVQQGQLSEYLRNNNYYIQTYAEQPGQGRQALAWLRSPYCFVETLTKAGFLVRSGEGSWC